MRASGILMHISSLPSPYGIGTMGKQAYAFVDFLKQSGQKYWQVLPLNPTGYGDSPYQSFSTFAGNHYLIDLDLLVEEALLRKEEIDSLPWGEETDRVDFGAMFQHRTKVLYQAYERFLGMPNKAFQQFNQQNQDWLPDYGLYMALKDHFPGTNWQNWPDGLRLRQAEAMQEYREKLKYKIVFQYFLQFKFRQQWDRLRAYANGAGIRIIGDVPIYVPLDSADVWANHSLFQLDEHRRPELVAGVPPDAFTADGQLWGNPLYNWQRLEETDYDWWLRRLGAAAKMYDVIRFDHFRGFESYWAVKAGEPTARDGQWVKGPGMAFIGAVKARFPEMAFIAEDLGYLTDEVRQLLAESGYPGMKVLEFAFDSREPSNYLPHCYTPHSVCYTGTHDNQTLRQWFDEAGEDVVAYAKEYMGLSDEEGYIWGTIRCGMASVSQLFVAQMQDYLELGARGRMNAPGSLAGGNWTWRAEHGVFTEELARKIHAMTRCFDRL